MKPVFTFERCRGMTSCITALLVWSVFSGDLAVAQDASAQAGAPATGFHKVLFLGNSITRHGPAPKIGWGGDWGMAASTKDKDFVHLVTASLSRSAGPAPQAMVRNIADFERQFATYDVNEKLREQFAFGADLVIVAIGENVPKLDSDQSKAQFKTGLTKLLRGVKGDRCPTIVVRSCFWANPNKDEILKQACQEAGGIYVDIGSLGKNEANFARSERQFQHAGVAAHPGDKGMQAIADAILAAIKQGSPGTR